MRWTNRLTYLLTYLLVNEFEWRDCKGWASECLDVKNCKWRLNAVWHRMLYSCTHVATVGVKWLTMKLYCTTCNVCRVNCGRFLVCWLRISCSSSSLRVPPSVRHQRSLLNTTTPQQRKTRQKSRDRNRKLRDWWRHFLSQDSRSLEVTPFDRSHRTSDSHSVVTLALSCTVSEI